MLAAKQVADLITFSRALMGLSLAWIGLVYQAAGLPLAAWIMILDWTGNFTPPVAHNWALHPAHFLL